MSILPLIEAIQKAARAGGKPASPRWPMIVLRSPKGWTGPKEVDGISLQDRDLNNTFTTDKPITFSCPFLHSLPPAAGP